MSEQARTVAERRAETAARKRLAFQATNTYERDYGVVPNAPALVDVIQSALTAYAVEIREAAVRDNAVLRAALTDARNALVYQGKHWPIDMTAEYAAIDAVLREQS